MLRQSTNWYLCNRSSHPYCVLTTRSRRGRLRNVALGLNITSNGPGTNRNIPNPSHAPVTSPSGRPPGCVQQPAAATQMRLPRVQHRNLPEADHPLPEHWAQTDKLVRSLGSESTQHWTLGVVNLVTKRWTPTSCSSTATSTPTANYGWRIPCTERFYPSIHALEHAGSTPQSSD